ncbi:early endosome antigen 1-like [Magallana gigas]|uniref:early endosome antigen 1-like n=1 Tax=Magallana gigas TaxID=29159 RepID=UPI0033412F19
MPLYIIIWCLCVIPTSGFSRLTDTKTQNVTLRDEAIATKTDVFKILLNQETLIRMFLVKDVQSLMKDMIEMKEKMTTSNKRLHDAEKEISSLKIDIHSLKTENQRLKEQAVQYQENFKFIDQNFSEIQQNFTSASFGGVQYETTVNEKIKEFENNTSMVLYSIKTEVHNLSVKLLDLNKHTTELNMSVSKMIESKLTEFSVSVNKSVSEINHKLLSSKDFHTQMVYNLSAVENDLTSIRKMISASKTSVSFTVGMTSYSSTWSGDILVFPHVVTNNGNGYNPSTGKFTAPTEGTYVFFVTAKTNLKNNLYLDIVHNDRSKVRTMSYNSASFSTGTNMAVLQLVKGDFVWVRRKAGQSFHSESVPITTFSGFHISNNWLLQT